MLPYRDAVSRPRYASRGADPTLFFGVSPPGRTILPAPLHTQQARTPVGSFQGALKQASAVELGVAAVKGVLAQARVEPAQVEDLYFGQVLQGGAGQSPARQVVLGSGMPDTTEATTVNKVCLVPRPPCVEKTPANLIIPARSARPE